MECGRSKYKELYAEWIRSIRITIHAFNSGYGVTTVGGYFIKEKTTTTPSDLSNLARGDVVGVRILRDATNALDTLEGKVIALGLLLEYTAHQ